MAPCSEALRASHVVETQAALVAKTIRLPDSKSQLLKSLLPFAKGNLLKRLFWSAVRGSGALPFMAWPGLVDLVPALVPHGPDLITRCFLLSSTNFSSAPFGSPAGFKGKE